MASANIVRFSLFLEIDVSAEKANKRKAEDLHLDSDANKTPKKRPKISTSSSRNIAESRVKVAKKPIEKTSEKVVHKEKKSKEKKILFSMRWTLIWMKQVNHVLFCSVIVIMCHCFDMALFNFVMNLYRHCFDSFCHCLLFVLCNKLTMFCSVPSLSDIVLFLWHNLT